MLFFLLVGSAIEGAAHGLNYYITQRLAAAYGGYAAAKLDPSGFLH